MCGAIAFLVILRCWMDRIFFVKNQQADVLWIAGCHVYVAGNFVNKKTMCVYLKKRTKAMSRK